MKSFIVFTVKKIVRTPIYLIFLLVPILFTAIGYGLNVSTEKTVNDISTTRESIIQLKDDLATIPSGGASNETKYLHTQLTNNEKFLGLLFAQNWHDAYVLKASLIDQDLLIAKQDARTAPKELIIAMDRDKQIYSYLSDHNIEHQDTDFPIHGGDVLIWIMQVIVPTIFLLVIIFGAAQLFTDKYINQINVLSVFPGSSLTKTLAEVIVGLGFMCIGYFGLLLIGFAISSLISNMGSFVYPYTSITDNVTTLIPLNTVFIRGMSLQILTLIFIVLFIYLLSLIFKKNMLTAFVSVGIIIGFQASLVPIEPLHQIAKYVPLSYLNSVSVVTNQLNNQINQSNITYTTGMIVTFISILLTCLLIVIFCNFSVPKQQNI